MKVRELIYKIKDKNRQGNFIVLYFNDLDKEIHDVIREHQYNPEYITHLKNLMIEFNVEDKPKDNIVEFMGSGKDVVELLKKALCDFDEIHVSDAVLTSTDKSIDNGTVVISLLINIPHEEKWISIYYTHMDEGVGYGSISYQEHNYRERPFPQNWVEKSKGGLFPWGNGALTERQILYDVLERKKCRNISRYVHPGIHAVHPDTHIRK